MRVVIDRNVLEWRLDPTSEHRLAVASDDARVIVVCNEGYASSLAAHTLQRARRDQGHRPRRRLPRLAPLPSTSMSSPMSGRSVVVVDAVRTPVGKRNGGLSSLHPAALLGRVQSELVARTGIDPADVGQVVGGCVSQVGEQSFNVTRTAWLAAGLPLGTPATTVDTQCGSSQQATNLAAALVAAGVVDVAMACGVEAMSRIPIGASSNKAFGLGIPIPPDYFARYEMTSQFEGAERIADAWQVTRDDTDRFGLASQERAARAWTEGRFDGQAVPVEAPDLGEDGTPTGATHLVARDEGLRETSLEKLATLKPVGRPDGVHTAGNSSQISDGAAAVLLTTEERASELGLTPMARIVDSCSSASTRC